jgi:hypothetical protein
VGQWKDVEKGYHFGMATSAIRKPHADIASHETDDIEIAIRAMEDLRRGSKWPEYVTGYEVEFRPDLQGQPAVWINVKARVAKGNANANVLALVFFVQDIEEAMKDLRASVSPVVRIVDDANGATPVWARGPGWVAL